MGGREAPGPLEAEGVGALGGKGGGAWGLWGRWRQLIRGTLSPCGGGREVSAVAGSSLPLPCFPYPHGDLAKEEDLETIGLPLSTGGIATS